MDFITEDFEVRTSTYDAIKKMKPNFGYNGFGELVYYRSYSRIMRDDFGEVLGQEDWADTVLRVINGVMSIRKDWYVRNRISWNEAYWQNYAQSMAAALFRMEWMPPGRGLWAMGTDAVRKRGAMPLYNCAFTEIGRTWIDDLCWLMDSSMCGVGVGFRPYRTNLQLQMPRSQSYCYIVPDTREGWVAALRRLLDSYNGGPGVYFDFSQVRGPGLPIKTFGGISSGPEPLRKLLDQVRHLCDRYISDPDYDDEVRFLTDLANLVGVCVISGNVRRSAEIALCEADDPIFGSLKDYKMFPERAAWGWMSNNSYLLSEPEHFEMMDEIAYANIQGHDVGYLNMCNLPLGRIGKNDGLRPDAATGINPCGEIPLEHREVCNLSETVPTRCATSGAWLQACEYAAFYSSTVTLLPTHQPSTNAVIARNRRIGVSLMDFSGWKHTVGVAEVTRLMRKGYARIREVNSALAKEAGIPESIRVTTVKPGGTVPKLAGRTGGAGHPTFEHTLRRIRVGTHTPINKILIEAGLPYEPELYTPDTNVFEYPTLQGPAEPATKVTLWEQAMNIVLLQREWSDNAVSNTLYFKPRWRPVKGDVVPDSDNHVTLKLDEDYCLSSPATGTHYYNIKHGSYKVQDGKFFIEDPNHEENQIADVLAHIAPVTKSVSLLPHSDAGMFAQSPEEGITPAEYHRRVMALKEIDWSKLSGSDGIDEKFCTGDACAIPLPTN